jgi:hypothetical protein
MKLPEGGRVAKALFRHLVKSQSRIDLTRWWSGETVKI